MTIHMRPQRARSREPFLADLTPMFLLRARRDLGIELAHHGLRTGRDTRGRERR